MVQSEMVLPEAWSRPAGYSHGMVRQGARILRVAGQVGRDEASGQVKEGFVAQWGQALANVAAVVTAAGGQPSDIIGLRVYVTSVEEYKAAQKELKDGYRAAVGKHFPAATLVQVSSLMEPEYLVEIDAEAVW